MPNTANLTIVNLVMVKKIDEVINISANKTQNERFNSDAVFISFVCCFDVHLSTVK